MTETPEAADRRPRVQRHLQAGEPRRRVQFGTGYSHRGPAPASPRRPGGSGTAPRAGRLRVLQIARP